MASAGQPTRSLQSQKAHRFDTALRGARASLVRPAIAGPPEESIRANTRRLFFPPLPPPPLLCLCLSSMMKMAGVGKIDDVFNAKTTGRDAHKDRPLHVQDITGTTPHLLLLLLLLLLLSRRFGMGFALEAVHSSYFLLSDGISPSQPSPA